MFQELKPAILITIVLTVLTGIAYPLAITAICQAVFHKQANGSLTRQNGKLIGSELIGQNFSKPIYFHPRPSAAGQSGYDATASGGSNLGPTNPALMDRLAKGVAQFRKENPDYIDPIPADAITASGSGLDPDISPANALAQVPRVAKARRVADDTIRHIVLSSIQGRDLGFLGEPRVNVLKLNMALDNRFPATH